MIPSSISPEAHPSERYVFTKLKRDLPESWTVIHGRRFILPATKTHGVQEGEVDFLVIDPARGVVALEVKGGGVEHTTEGWFSTDRNRERHLIKAPGEQVQAATHAIYRFLSNAPSFGGRNRRVSIRWGVVLPDIDVNRDLGAALPRKLIIDRLDLADAFRAVGRVFEAQRVAGPELDTNTVGALLESLLPTFQLIPSLAAQFQQEREELIRLTDEQVTTLDSLESQKRVAVEGVAGTGKTVLALEKARRLVAEGKKTLLLCYNTALAHHLSQSEEGFEVAAFHQICHAKAAAAGIAFDVPTERRKKPSFWEDEAPLLLLEAIETVPDERYDAIVIDEGQDFTASWWQTVDDLLFEGSQGTLYVFFDRNQNLRGGALPKELDIAPFRLVFNCRNSETIAAYSSSIVGVDAKVRPGSPAGADVRRFDCSSKQQMVETIQGQVQGLIARDGIHCEDIVILTPGSTRDSCLKNNRRFGNYELIGIDTPRGPNTIWFTSTDRFKGLEKDVVILTDVDKTHFGENREHAYVGSSRARLLLIIVTRPDSSPA